MKLSAVLAVRDEELMLEAALALLDFCDEIVVVIDDRTTDRTAEIARRHTDQVHLVPFENFAQLKNAGVQRASGDWIVFCDADERITPRLGRQIQAAIDEETGFWAFRTPTVNFFWGTRMRHGGWNETHVKIVRREHARYHGDVHELLDVPSDRIGWLDGERWHFSHRSMRDSLVKTARFAELEATKRTAAGARPVTAGTLLRALAMEFARRAIRRAGWRDGMPGVIEMLYQPFSAVSVQATLWEHQNRDEIARRYRDLERVVAEQR